MTLPMAFLVLGLIAGLAVILAARFWPSADEPPLLHRHEALTHDHLHVHDEHHQHAHAGDAGAEPHSHPHVHDPVQHVHDYVIDLHHPHWPTGAGNP